MLRFALILTFAAGFAGIAGAPPVHACGADSDCLVDGGRSYRIRMPQNTADANPGAIFFAHGFRGSSAGVMRNKSLASMAESLGVALVALDAGGEDWALPGSPHPPAGRDEMAYADNVIADVTARFGIDPTRIVASGFSAGAMLVWNLACERGSSFAGFVPISGTFWAPVPESCASAPASLIHIHGDSDKTVPLLGRPIARTRQGAVPKALAMYARHGDFGPARKQRVGDLSCKTQRNPDGKILAFCAFSGGHSFRTGFLSQAWGMLAKAGQI